MSIETSNQKRKLSSCRNKQAAQAQAAPGLFECITAENKSGYTGLSSQSANVR